MIKITGPFLDKTKKHAGAPKCWYNPAKAAEPIETFSKAVPLDNAAVERLLYVAFTNPRFFPYLRRLVLMIRFGLRETLAFRIYDKHILRDGRESKITLIARINPRAKGQPRCIRDYPAASWEWFDLTDSMSDVEIAEGTMDKVLDDLYRAVGMKQNQGELRDTFASACAAVYGLPATAKLLGHAPGNIRTVRRYVRAVSREQAMRFLTVTPKDIPGFLEAVAQARAQYKRAAHSRRLSKVLVGKRRFPWPTERVREEKSPRFRGLRRPVRSFCR